MRTRIWSAMKGWSDLRGLVVVSGGGGVALPMGR